MNNFQNEWAIIHSDIERYERFSLVIKLISVVISVIFITHSINEWFSIAVILVLWLQEGIWKTFQKRLESRIIFIEQELQTNSDEDGKAFQLYTQWNKQRQNISGLIKEYLSSATKPTIAYPYIILIVLMLVLYLYR